MNSVPASEVLRIVHGGEEVPGVIVYGLVGPEPEDIFARPPSGWAGCVEPNVFALRGECWQVGMWEFPIYVWPDSDKFNQLIGSAMRLLVEMGCRVSWVGAEGLAFMEPPHLFDPHYMSGGVLASMTSSGEAGLPLRLDAPLKALDDIELRRLRDFARGLADSK